MLLPPSLPDIFAPINPVPDTPPPLFSPHLGRGKIIVARYVVSSGVSWVFRKKMGGGGVGRKKMRVVIVKMYFFFVLQFYMCDGV